MTNGLIAEFKRLVPTSPAANSENVLGERLGSGPDYRAAAETRGETTVHGIAHGGFIFLLADSAFAFACNSHNERAVAAQCNISFIRPGKLGDLLIATAREISRTGRSGIYDVRVTVDDTPIAELRGHSRTVGGAWVPSVEPDAKLK
jgi:phenylacetic acid degradation protein PaaD